MSRINNIILLHVIALLLFACTKEQSAPPRNFAYEYYPLKLKSVSIYDVDSTYYNDFNNSVTNFKFELKDSVASAYLDLAGDSVFRVERYKKLENSNVWTYQKTITKSRSTRMAEETIDNQTFVRLIFPPELYTSWNGNSKNTLEEQSYYISEFPITTIINNTTYNSSLIVQQIDEENLLTKNFAEETYAPNIGLIKKEVTDIEYVFATNVIDKGYIYTMLLKSFVSN